MSTASPLILLDSIRKEKLRRRAQRSLNSFTQQAWDIIEPGSTFRNNWHLEAICEHLEAVSNGEIENLVINIPPGCCKSILVSVAWPAWEWSTRPELRVMGASYGADLAIRDSSKCRDIILSEWYQENWPQVQIKPGEDQKTKYSLTAGGWRMATSVGGRATGEHPDRKIVDDPHNARQSESEAERINALTWFDRTLSTRGKSRGARTVVVMQRLHESDVTGHILKELKEDYEHLCIPMEYERSRSVSVTSLGFKDPRTEENELLWPELFPEKSVEALKRSLGEYGTSGQLQQRPSPAEGGLIKRSWFKMLPADEPLPKLSLIVQSYDTAFTEKTTNDPTAHTCWGVFNTPEGKCVVLLDCWQEHLSYADLRKKAYDEYKSKYGEKDKGVDVVLIEEKGSGISLIQDLRRARIPVHTYNPGRADKTARVHAITPLLEAGLVYLPESKKRPGDFPAWTDAFINQLLMFPNGEHDDLVDTMTQALIYLRDRNLLTLDREKYTEEYAPPRERINPYAV